MLEMIRKARQNEDGFTLIELLMVIVILGILSGIVVFAVGGISDRGQKSACKAEFKTIQVAEEAYFASPAPGGAGTYTDSATLVTTGFLGSSPKLYSAAVASGKYTISPVGTTCAADPFV